MTIGGPLVGLAIGVLGIVGATWFTPPIQLVFNPTDSAPRGWYVVIPTATFRIGDYVVARLPTDAAFLAAKRAYLPLKVPLLKQVGAVGGTRVCGCESVVYVQGIPLGRTLSADSDGRPLASWLECRELASDELFLLNPDIPASFDSRYFGPVKVAEVRGRALPLWTWTRH